MKITSKIILTLTILLSIATGMFKILQQKADIELFNRIGIGVVGTTGLGIIQLAGGILLIFPKYRKLGATIMVVTFLLAAVAVFANQMFIFGMVSILFIGMALFILLNTLRNEKKSEG
jgi:hypothetical protein